MSFLEKSHPEHAAEVAEATASAVEELVAIARRIRLWQEGRRPRLSDEQMLRTFGGLGSTKTYRRLRDGDVEGLILENHLPKYRGVLAQLESITAAAAEDIYDDLAPTVECSAAIAGLLAQRGKTRLVLIEGPTGSGKTTALQVIQAKYPGSTATTEAHEGWASLNCALGDLCRAVSGSGIDLPNATAARLALCVELLKKSRRVLIIDEAHHCTAQVLNTVKTLLNLTDSVVVMAGIDTLWRKLTARSWEEARQLIHNRLFERVRLSPPLPDDAEIFLRRRVPGLEGQTIRPACERISAMSAHLGSWAFLRRVADRVAAEGEATAPAILAAAANLKANLETR